MGEKPPIPSLRFRRGRFFIYWTYLKKRFEFSTGLVASERDKAEILRCRVEISLRTGCWDAWARDIPATISWLEQHGGNTPEGAEIVGAETPNAELLHRYLREFPANKRSIKCLNTLALKYNLSKMSGAEANEFITALATTGESPTYKYLSWTIGRAMGEKEMTLQEIRSMLAEKGVTYSKEQFKSAMRNRDVFEIKYGNRRSQNKFKAKCGRYQNGRAPRTVNTYLIAFKQFYRWAVREKICAKNPFENIKAKKAEQVAGIIYLTREERARIFEARPPISVYIALYAGLRRGEISRLQWEDVDLKNRWIHVKKTKTGRPRYVPISAELKKYLAGVPQTGQSVCGWDEKFYQSKVELDDLIERLPALATKIRWNVFRHTFASLLAQSGKISIDQICAMMGNTPEVCRRHYAHLIPNAVEQSGIDCVD